MFASWGRAVYRARWLTIAVAGVVGVLAAVYGAGVFGSLSAGGFADPDSESARATRLLEQGAAGRTAADVVVLYRSERSTVDDAGYQRAVTGSLAALPTERVDSAATYWSTRDQRLVSADRRSTYAVLVLAGEDDSARAEDYEAIRDRLDVPGLDVRVGGPEAVFADVSEQVEADIARAETISLPIVLVLCVLIYGSVVAASLPLLVGGIAVLGAFAAVRGLTMVTDVSVFSINIITLLGLGLAIDYALFVVTRFREELARSASIEDAVAATVATAGRTIAWSGLTVAICLASLLVFPQTFLRSMGLGGVAAVLVAMTAALTVLPAVLGVLGRRVDALRVARRPRRARDGADGRWARVAAAVMRRPLLLGGAVLVLLLGLGAPFLGVSFGGVDARTLPESAQSRQVSEAVAEEFPGGGTSVAEVVVTGLPGQLVDAYADAVGLVPGVADVSVRSAGTGSGALARDTPAVVSVAYRAEAQSEEARAVVTGIRDVPVPSGGEALVRGETAQLIDLLGSLRSTLPWMAVLVVATTFVLLFAAFGSVVLPLKAIAVAALSLTASFGVVVWVFQHGNGADLLGFTTTGYIDATQPILMLAVLFGLSMDYELFLLSRVREEWDRTHDNARAVAAGLQRTGRIITSAALLLLVVVAGFSTSGITFIMMMGVGMIVALVVDATLVRAVLVPATMRLLGDANWYAPAPMARWWERSGLREQDPSSLERPPVAAAGAGTSGPARRRRRSPRHRAERRSGLAPTAARVLVGAGRRAG